MELLYAYADDLLSLYVVFFQVPYFICAKFSLLANIVSHRVVQPLRVCQPPRVGQPLKVSQPPRVGQLPSRSAIECRSATELVSHRVGQLPSWSATESVSRSVSQSASQPCYLYQSNIIVCLRQSMGSQTSLGSLTRPATS